MKNDISVVDHTAIRVALWRALHLQVDSPPYILEDDIGLKLIAPNENWKQEPAMHPQGTSGYRASIIARARYIEDLVKQQADLNVSQYVIMGAGLDTFAQRNPKMGEKIKLFEIDKLSTQSWKKQRLIDLGFGIPSWLKFVPVDFENGPSWMEQLKSNGFKTDQPAVLASTGVSMYLTKEANEKTLREISKLAPGSTLAMTFVIPLELLDEDQRPKHQVVYEKAREAGTPFLSFFTPEEAVALAKKAGFKTAKAFLITQLTERYFHDRKDGLKPANGEAFLIATT
jgi:methyltransferase (TIGR00027 family)